VIVPPKKKVTLYFSAGVLEETQHEAIRQDRSISWIIQAAWRLSRDEVRRLPGATGGVNLPSAPTLPRIARAPDKKPRGR